MSADVRVSGPFFNDGTRASVLRDICQDSQAAIGEQGVLMVRQQLGSVLQHPTGYYSSRITSTNQVDSTRIGDSMVVYGPWLEGVGSRNRTTRFKGYATFRRVTGRLQVTGARIAQQIVSANLGRLR